MTTNTVTTTTTDISLAKLIPCFANVRRTGAVQASRHWRPPSRHMGCCKRLLSGRSWTVIQRLFGVAGAV
jgi:hypothetical protein